MRRVPIRVVCHAILRVDVVPAHVQQLRREMEQLCTAKGARLLDFVVGFGGAKEEADYPALTYARNGVADVLLVVRAPIFDGGPSVDLLEAALLPDERPIAWGTVPTLRRLGLLPAAVGLPSFARQRATELRGRGFPLDAIARWLDTEGYAAPAGARSGDGWTRGRGEAASRARVGTGGRGVIDRPM
mgnify:CR=1 FL=1